MEDLQFIYCKKQFLINGQLNKHLKDLYPIIRAKCNISNKIDIKIFSKYYNNFLDDNYYVTDIYENLNKIKYLEIII